MHSWQAKLSEDFVTAITPVPLTSEIVLSLKDAIMKHALKAPDAVQLQSSIIFARQRVVRRSQITFISSDVDLTAAARSERFQIISPLAKDSLDRLERIARS